MKANSLTSMSSETCMQLKDDSMQLEPDSWQDIYSSGNLLDIQYMSHPLTALQIHSISVWKGIFYQTNELRAWNSLLLPSHCCLMTEGYNCSSITIVEPVAIGVDILEMRKKIMRKYSKKCLWTLSTWKWQHRKQRHVGKKFLLAQRLAHLTLHIPYIYSSTWHSTVDQHTRVLLYYGNCIISL